METKPAIYCTEFWFNLLLQFLLTLNTLNIWNYIPERFKWASVLAQAFLGAFYFVGRGIAKNKGGFDPHLNANYKLFPHKRDMIR